MKMSKVDDILQNLILSKETIFSEVSSLPVKSRLIMLLNSEASGKKVSQLENYKKYVKWDHFKMH